MNNNSIQPYLMFNGRCDEALAFYKETLGATVEMLMRYNESPEPMPPGMLVPGFEAKVMHTTFHIGKTTLMASDGCGGEDGGDFKGFSLSLSVPDETEAKRAFEALSKGGQVRMPLAKTFWSPSFGMLTDQFGLGWMVSVEPECNKPA